MSNRAKSRAKAEKARSGGKASWLPWAGGGAAVAAVIVGVALLHGGGVGATTGGSAVVYSGGETTSTPSTFSSAVVAAGGGYRVTSVTGQTVTFPQGRPTLLYFMSASCSSCWQGSTQIAQIYPKLEHMAQVVSLDVTPQVDTSTQIEQMVQSTGVTWPQAFATSSILTHYHISYLDTAVVLSPTGKVLYDGGIPSNTRLMALIRQAGKSA